jgi:hypothetical protein
MKKRLPLFRLLIFAVLALALPAQARAFTPQVQPELVAVDRENRAVSFSAVVTARKWQDHVAGKSRNEKDFDPDHWHLIISATHANQAVGRLAIFSAWASDEQISEALAALGAKGEPFDKRSFSQRLDPDSSYPDLRPRGSRVQVYVTWSGLFGITRTVEANEFLKSSTGRKLEPVYIGKQSSSHCIVCLYGCVGAICPNRSLSVRDYFDRGAEWRLRSGILPEDGTEVLITLKLLE